MYIYIYIYVMPNLSLLCGVRDTIHLVPVRYWRTDHGRVVRTLGIIAGAGVVLKLWGSCSKLASSTWSSKLVFILLPLHRDMFPCSLHTNIISCQTCFIFTMKISTCWKETFVNSFEISFEIACFVHVRVYRIGVTYSKFPHKIAFYCVWICSGHTLP